MVCPPYRWSGVYPFLDRASAFPTVLTLCPFCGWCARLPEGFDSHCTPSSMVGTPSQRSWLPLHPFLDSPGSTCLREILALHCTPSWMVSAFPWVLIPIVPRLLPRVLAFIAPLLGWCVPLSKVLTPDSHCAPSWMVCPPCEESCLSLCPFLDNVSAFPRVLIPFVGCCVRLPEGLVSLCLSLCRFCF